MSKKKSRQKFGISDGQLQSFVRFVELVHLGLRQAYLVDCCSVDANTCLLIILENHWQGMCVISLGTDCIITKIDYLCEIISGLKDWSSHSHPLVVDVNGPLPRMCAKDEVNEIVAILVRACLPIFVSCKNESADNIVVAFDATEEFMAKVGMPFFAGWLLGYPCVYRSTLIGSCEALAFCPLVKTTISLCHANTAPTTRHSKVDLKEFTIPKCLVEDEIRQHLLMAVNAHVEGLNLILKKISQVWGQSAERNFCIEVLGDEFNFSSVTL